MWISKEDTSHSETFFAIDTNFAKFIFAIIPNDINQLLFPQAERVGNPVIPSFPLNLRGMKGGYRKSRNDKLTGTYVAVYPILQSLDILSFTFSYEQILYPFSDGKGARALKLI